MFKLSIESKVVQEDVISWGLAALDMLEIVLDQTGSEVVRRLRSYTNEWRPPIRRYGPKRRAHPGHWADVTHELEQSYYYRVVRTVDSVRLEIGNTAEHAVYVEAMDGFFVVTGIMETDGPVVAVLRQVVPRIAPGWTLA